MANEEPRWKPRRWNDPSTAVALILLVVGLALVVIDGLDEVWFGVAVSFDWWPHYLMGAVLFWFFGYRLWRVGPPGGGQ